MTKTPKTLDESKSDTEQTAIISVNNRKVSQLANKCACVLCDSFIDRYQILCFRAITRTKNRYWKSVDVTGSITVWMN